MRDVIQQRQAAKNAQRMAAIVEHPDDAIVRMTLAGRITSWNPAAEGMFGYTERGVIGRPVRILEGEDRAGEIDEVLAKLNASQSTEHLDTIGRRKDGSAVAVLVSVSPIRNEAGVVLAACAIAHDVTERRDVFEVARAMIEPSVDSLVSISSEGKITDANAATVRFAGLPREELIGTDFSRYFTERVKAQQVYP